jgi:hypothetical protein
MSIETMKLALEALEYAWGFDCDGAEAVKKSHLAIVALRAAIEQAGRQTCQCPACKVTHHTSECAVHNEPAYPKGVCDCGAIAQAERQKHIFDCPRCGHCCPSTAEQALICAHGVSKIKCDFCKQAEQAQPVWDASAPLVVHPHPAFQNTQPQRQWQGLTSEERFNLAIQTGAMTADWLPFMEAVEAKLKTKNL